MMFYLKYLMYKPWLSRIVVCLPIPKAWKIKVVMWQFMGMSGLALEQLRAAKGAKQ